MKLNFLIDKEQDRDFIYSLANKNMSEWAVDLETAQAMAQDIVAYSAEIAKLRAALKEIADCHAAELAAKEKYIEVQDIIISGQRKEIGTKDAEIARLSAALQEIADYDYQCQCTEGMEDGEEHFGCPSCWARAALKETK